MCITHIKFAPGTAAALMISRLPATSSDINAYTPGLQISAAISFSAI